MSLEDAVRVFLASYFTFVALGYTAKLIAVRRRTGHSVVATSGLRPLQAFTHGLFGIFRAAIWAVCVVRVPFPELDHYLGLFSGLQFICVQGSGMILLLLALFGIIYVHTYMGEEWRSGVMPNGAPMLLTEGPYRMSRNPIFILVGVGQLGFFLSLPSVFAFICMCVGWLVLCIQVRIEENSLKHQFCSDYCAYAVRTPRWLFKLV